MAFNSITFLIFLIIVYTVYRRLPHGGQNVLLLISSYLFYAWWEVCFLVLIVLSTGITYSSGLMIGHGKMSLGERMASSLWAIAGSLVLVVLGWDDLPRLIRFSFLGWTPGIATSQAWMIVGCVCALTITANLLHQAASRIEAKNGKILFLVVGVGANLLMLGFFKYYNFFVENIEAAVRGIGFNSASLRLGIILPIGISFYSFKNISYVVDVYRGAVRAAHSYVNFALYVAFFPALLAGPIDRAGKLLPQLEGRRRITREQTLRGLHLIFYGIFKKMVIADGVVGTVNYVFGAGGALTWMDVIMGTVLFTIQIYCDFSGYTDMARGTAKLFGIDLMVNFNLPYFSKSPREFWSRWHISLSTWLRDYLYISMGGNREGLGKTLRNLMVTMVLGGLWHGAAWNFVVWGGYHGLLLSLHRVKMYLFGKGESSRNVLVRTLSILVFFALVCYGWLLFRAVSTESILVLSKILVLDFGNIGLTATMPRFAAMLGLLILIPIEIAEYIGGGTYFYRRLPVPAWTAVYALMIFAIILGTTNEAAQFVYFNF